MLCSKRGKISHNITLLIKYIDDLHLSALLTLQLTSGDSKRALCSDCKVVLTHSFCEDSPVLAFLLSTCPSVLNNSFQYPETTYPVLSAYPATCYVVSKKGVDRIVVDGTSL